MAWAACHIRGKKKIARAVVAEPPTRGHVRRGRRVDLKEKRSAGAAAYPAVRDDGDVAASRTCFKKIKIKRVKPRRAGCSVGLSSAGLNSVRLSSVGLSSVGPK